MENKICAKCGFLTFSKNKERKVMCECEWKQMEDV